MKRNIFISVFIVALIILSSFTCLAVSGEEATVNVGYDAAKISRFENMLDHNYLYGNDFDDMHTVINNSCLALLYAREGNYISTDFLFPFIDNMYGIPVYCDETLNSQFPRKDGAVYIVPRGFIQYEHTVTKIQENGTMVTINSIAKDIDSGEEIPCESVFVLTNESAFGYNLIACNLK